MFEPEKIKKSTHLPKTALLIIGGVLITGASFLSGVAYQKSKQPTTAMANTANMQRVQGGFGRRFSGSRPISGTVSAVSSTSITIAQSDGTSKTFAITSDTTVTNQGASAAVSDIATGDTVFIIASTSNSSDAARILLNPSFGGGFGGQSASGTPSDIQIN